MLVYRVTVEYAASAVANPVRTESSKRAKGEYCQDLLRLQGTPEHPCRDQCSSIPDHTPEILIIECRSILASHDLTELRMAPFAWSPSPLRGRS